MVLPIYFALIGGTFWIGELLLGRHNLLVSDRLASNHWGVRHDRENDKRNPNDKTMLYRLNVWLFDVLSKDLGNTPIASRVVQTRALRNKYAWAQTTGGKVSLWVPQPSWIKSWLHGYDDTWEETLEGARASQSFNLGARLAKIRYEQPSIVIQFLECFSDANKSWRICLSIMESCPIMP